MKTKSGDFVLPGDALGVTEEFIPSEWTYEEEGKIRSLVAGTVSVDNKNKKISIIPKTKCLKDIFLYKKCKKENHLI